VAGEDREAILAQGAESFRRAALSLEVGGEGGESRVVEDVGEVGDVGADNDLADPPTGARCCGPAC
jgi:hypothetical protein